MKVHVFDCAEDHVDDGDAAGSKRSKQQQQQSPYDGGALRGHIRRALRRTLYAMHPVAAAITVLKFARMMQRYTKFAEPCKFSQKEDEQKEIADAMRTCAEVFIHECIAAPPFLATLLACDAIYGATDVAREGRLNDPSIRERIVREVFHDKESITRDVVHDISWDEDRARDALYHYPEFGTYRTVRDAEADRGRHSQYVCGYADMASSIGCRIVGKTSEYQEPDNKDDMDEDGDSPVNDRLTLRGNILRKLDMLRGIDDAVRDAQLYYTFKAPGGGEEEEGKQAKKQRTRE